jgi:hypothetical protein
MTASSSKFIFFFGGPLFFFCPLAYYEKLGVGNPASYADFETFPPLY